MKSFQQFINEAFENDTLSTQLTKGNTGTYKKTGEYLVKHNLLQPKSSILSIGSGAIYNAQALHSSLGENHEHELLVVYGPTVLKEQQASWADSANGVKA